jgi:hypothetical protein
VLTVVPLAFFHAKLPYPALPVARKVTLVPEEYTPVCFDEEGITPAAALLTATLSKKILLPKLLMLTKFAHHVVCL